MTWAEEQEITLRRAVRTAITSEIGRCQKPPMSPERAAEICIDEIRLTVDDPDMALPIEGYEQL
jgi:hypothetical protein